MNYRREEKCEREESAKARDAEAPNYHQAAANVYERNDDTQALRLYSTISAHIEPTVT